MENTLRQPPSGRSLSRCCCAGDGRRFLSTLKQSVIGCFLSTPLFTSMSMVDDNKREVNPGAFSSTCALLNASTFSTSVACSLSDSTTIADTPSSFCSPPPLPPLLSFTSITLPFDCSCFHFCQFIPLF